MRSTDEDRTERTHMHVDNIRTQHGNLQMRTEQRELIILTTAVYSIDIYR